MLMSFWETIITSGYTVTLFPSKHFWVLQTFEKKSLVKLKNDGYENHI